MMFRRQMLRSGVDIRAHFGFAPHQLSGVTQAHTDKSVFIVKPHSLPILPSHFVWRVFASPVAATGKLSATAPLKLKLPDVKWTAAPLPEIQDVTEEPAALKRFTQMSRKRLLAYSGATSTNGSPTSKKSSPQPMYRLEAIEYKLVNDHKPKKTHKNVALLDAKTPRSGFSLLFDYRGLRSSMTSSDWLNRCLYIETLAGVSEMVIGVARHFRSLRSLKRDDIWLEAENERIHMQIFSGMKEAGLGFQVAMLTAQGVFFPAFFLTYMVSPKTCHRFVDFLDEEAAKTYTHLLEDMEHGHLDEWCTMPAPLIGRSYYDLPDDAKVYDVIKCIRAERASHTNVRRTYASLDPKTSVNTVVVHSS